MKKSTNLKIDVDNEMKFSNNIYLRTHNLLTMKTPQAILTPSYVKNTSSKIPLVLPNCFTNGGKTPKSKNTIEEKIQQNIRSSIMYKSDILRKESENLSNRTNNFRDTSKLLKYTPVTVHNRQINTNKKARKSFENFQKANTFETPNKDSNNITSSRNFKIPSIFAPISITSLLNYQHIPLDTNVIKNEYKNYEKTVSSYKANNIIKSYAANTYQGILRVCIVLNVKKPDNIACDKWPKVCVFSIYDGHGGSSCADYLKDNLHNFVIKEGCFLKDPRTAIIKGFENAENEFINNHTVNNNGEVIDRSGSCAIVIFTIDDSCYVANVGDSRGVISRMSGKVVEPLTNDHKPSNQNEAQRISKAGGSTTARDINLLQFPEKLRNAFSSNQVLLGPHRIYPGRLSVSRSFGDIEAKSCRLGGIPGVLIATPEITSFRIDENADFIILGCDGIFDQLSNEDICDCVWKCMNNETRIRNIHNQSALAVDMIIKSCMNRNGLDNLTCVIISFANFERFYNKLEYGREEGGKCETEKVKSATISKEIYIKTASDNDLTKVLLDKKQLNKGQSLDKKELYFNKPNYKSFMKK